MPNYRNKSKIVKREELIPPGKLQEGMIITFRYNSGSDKTPVVLVIYYDKKKKMIEGINLNYITISRVGRLVELMGDAKVGINKDEIVDEFEKDITRIQLSSKKTRDNMTPQKFYKDVVKGDFWSEAYAEHMLEVELEEYSEYINDLVEVELNQNQFDALVSWVYNLGPTNLKSSTLLKVLNEGDFDEVPRQIRRWNKASGEVLEGLVRRREAEALLFQGKEWSHI